MADKKVARLILGINPFGYLLHLLSGAPVIGKLKRLSRFYYQTPLNYPVDILQKIPVKLELEAVQVGVLFRGKVFPDLPDPALGDLLQEKLGIEPIHPIGTTLYTLLPIRDRNWYQIRDLKRIKVESGGFIVETDQDTWFAEELYSTLPARVLAELMQVSLPLRRIYVFRYPVDRSLIHTEWRDFYYIYDLDRPEVACYVRLRDEQDRESWVEEHWSFEPRPIGDAKQFYTLPLSTRPMQEFHGVRLYGTYAEWSYRVTLLDVILRYMRENGQAVV